MKEYSVNLLVTTRVTYNVSAASPEDAENIAEDYLRDEEVPENSDILEVISEDILPLLDDSVETNSLKDLTIKEW
jgi:hypothetical protein